MALQALRTVGVFATGRENRRGARTRVSISGKIYLPDSKITGECSVYDLSPDGAGLRATCSVGVGAAVVLYIGDFGRFDGAVVQRNRLQIGVQFKNTEVRRERTAKLIAGYVQTGKVDQALLRSSTRVRDVSALHKFVSPSGQAETCEIVDIALSGAALKTEARPPVGEHITFGRTKGLVVRHTDCGIVVKFLEQIALDSLSSSGTA